MCRVFRGCAARNLENDRSNPASAGTTVIRLRKRKKKRRRKVVVIVVVVVLMVHGSGRGAIQ